MAALIRMATAADAAAVLAIYGPMCENTPISFEDASPAVEEMARRIRDTTEKLPWLVLEDAGVAGYVYARPFRDRAAYRWSVEVTVYVHPQRQRQGVARALYTSLFRILTVQGCFKAYAGVTIPNLPSEHLHEAVGFTPVGVYHGVGHKFGTWHDVRFYEMALQPEAPVPAEPLPVAAVVDGPAWRLALDVGLALYRP